MANIQKSTESLIPCTSKDCILTEDRQAFSAFLKVFSSIGGEVNEITIYLMQKSIAKNRITVAQIEEGLLRAYEKPRYGKVAWSDVLDGIPKKEPIIGTF